MRLTAAIKIPSLVQNETLLLFHQIKIEWIKHGEEYEFSFSFIKILWSFPEINIARFVKEESLPEPLIEDLIKFRYMVSDENKLSKESLAEMYESEGISENLKFKLCIMLSDQKAFHGHEYAASRLDVELIENVKHWCFLIGNLDDEVALLGLEKLKSRTISKEEYISLLSLLAIGLNYVMEPTLSLGGGLDRKTLHGTTAQFSDWLLSEFSEHKFKDAELLKVLDNISSITESKTQENIEVIMKRVLDAYDLSKKGKPIKEETEHSISRGLQLCERENVKLSEAILIRIISLDIFNLLGRALTLLLKIANEKTLYALVKMHGEKSDWYEKGSILDAIEKLSSRFSLHVVNENGKLRVAKE